MYRPDPAEKSSSGALLPMLETQQLIGSRQRKPTTRYVIIIAAALSCCVLLFSNALPACLRQMDRVSSQLDHTFSHESKVSTRLDDFRTCSVKNFQATHFPFLEGVQPISRDEFVARRQRLAHALLSDGADAFVVEPGEYGRDDSR